MNHEALFAQLDSWKTAGYVVRLQSGLEGWVCTIETPDSFVSNDRPSTDHPTLRASSRITGTPEGAVANLLTIIQPMR
jgi:hypothetical protein